MYNNTSMIPKKTLSVSASAAQEAVCIDTHGLECMLKSDGAEVYFKTNPQVSDSQAYVISAGEIFRFCGIGYFKAKQDTELKCVMFETL